MAFPFQASQIVIGAPTAFILLKKARCVVAEVKEKFCPFLTAGLFVGSSAPSAKTTTLNFPKCRKGDCEIWVEHHHNNVEGSGHCGLKRS